MATTTRNELKQYFQKGKIPTQAHFEALIDSGLNQLDDRLRSSPNDPLTLLPSGPGGGLLGFSRIETNAGVESLKPTWLIRHEPAGHPTPGLLFQGAQGKPALCLQGGTGYVGIGTPAPGAQLDVLATGTTWNGWFEAIRFSQTEHSAITHPTGGLLFGLHGDRKFYFGDTRKEGTSGYLMTVDANTGNVGIGTTAPDRPLTLQPPTGSVEWLSLRAATGQTKWHVNNLSNGFNLAETVMVEDVRPVDPGTLRPGRPGRLRPGSTGGDVGLDGPGVELSTRPQVFDGRFFIASGGNVGIGTTDPAGKLQVVNGRVDITSSPTVALGGLRFNGLASELRRAQLVLSSEYSDLVIASGQRNYRHGSTLTFASFNPDDATVYRKWVINQGNWQDAGGRMGFLEFGYQDAVASNPHENINDERTVLTLDGANRRVGIGTTVPEASLHVVGDVILGELRLSPQGRMNSSMWRVTQVYNNQTGPLPLRTGVFDSGGGTLLIISSGSGWKAPPGAGWIGMGIQVDGTHYGSHGVFCNEANSHRAFATNPLVVRGIAAGRHTLSLVTTDATTDHNDRYSVTVIEFPF